MDDEKPKTKESKPRVQLRRKRFWGLFFLFLFGLGLFGAYRGFLRFTRIEPPAEGSRLFAAMEKAPLVSRGARSFLGENWASRERGIWEYHLAGEPVPLGYAHARLGTHILIETDDYMFGEMRRYVPSQVALFLIRLGVLYRYRTLLDHVSVPLRLEMTGLSVGQPALHDDFLPEFHRIVFYHALHDITQTLEHSPLLGCTAFAAAGGATPSGHVIIGRNFDFEGPPIFDRDKAVLFFKPAGKLPFASVAWTGMIGAVTGLNAAGIYVSVNALRTSDKSASGVPVELLLREVLESAHTLDEAIELVQSRAVMVPDLYLIADGKSGESAVIERSPTRMAVRRSRDIMAVANHAILPEFQGDRENERLKLYFTSGARMTRMEELLSRHRGRIDAETGLAILRDKRGVGDKKLGLGNRNALDALIATHSVVVDASELILWVSSGPHELGRYIAFDLRRELLGEDRPAPADLPADPTLDTPEYRDYLIAERALQTSQALLRHGERDRAIEEAERAVALAPLSPEARKLLADLLYARNHAGDRARAREQDGIFLTLAPPYLRDVEEVRGRLGG